MNSAFRYATKFNNDGKPLYWDTQSVSSMGWTFAWSSFDQDISTRDVAIGADTVKVWDTSLVEYFDNMFNGASRFNQNIGDWNTSSALNMSAMFKGASTFDQNIAGWVTSSVTNMNEMFSGARAFNQDLSEWDVNAVTLRDAFDADADAWCGLGFENRGRPGSWDPESDGASCDVMLSIDAPDSVVAGDELTYVLNY